MGRHVTLLGHIIMISSQPQCAITLYNAPGNNNQQKHRESPRNSNQQNIVNLRETITNKKHRESPGNNNKQNIVNLRETIYNYGLLRRWTSRIVNL